MDDSPLYDAYFLPPSEFVPCPESGTIFEIIAAIGWDKASLVISAPEAFMEWERDKEGSVCNPEVFRQMPEEPGVYRCKIRFNINIEVNEDDQMYMYSYICESFNRINF